MSPIILAIDTSTDQMTVVVSRGKIILASQSIQERHQVQKLLRVIDDSLQKSKLTLKNIDAFSTTKGPGSFTGIRTALGTIKGLAYSRQKPVIAISTMEAMAYPCDHNHQIAPVLNARRGFIYTGLYKFQNVTWVQIMPPSMMAVEDFSNRMPSDVVIVGQAARNYQNENPAWFLNSMQFGNSKFDHICDTTLCEISLKKYINQEFEDVFSLEPLYIQKTAAEGYV